MITREMYPFAVQFVLGLSWIDIARMNPVHALDFCILID